jgi:4-aminobutyrate aminotransferase and related aminotransferases
MNRDTALHQEKGCEECPTKQTVLELRKKHFSPSVSVSYSNTNPLMIMGGSKARLFDECGNSYLDTRNNVAHVGHQNPHVIQAVQKQIELLNTNTRYLHPNAVQLAKRLSDLLPDSLNKVFFVNSGSEANDLAIRLARAKTKSKNMICLDHAYHGHTLGTLEVSPYKYTSLEFDMDFNKDIGDHVMKVPCPDTFRGEHRGDSASHDYAKYVVQACDEFRDRGENVCAFIMEGGMSVAGVILPPPNYLKTCVQAVRSAGGVYIADEVQTGLGRLGTDCFWAFQYGGNDNLVPDIVTIGKPFGNGMPLAAVITTEDISDAFNKMGVEYFNTFGGNPVCTAAGLAVLDEIVRMDLPTNASVVGSYMMNKFRQLNLECCKNVAIGDIRGMGLFIGVELVRSIESLEPATVETSYICTILKEKFKILTSIDGPFENVIVIKPPMVFAKGDVDIFVSAFLQACESISEVELSLTTRTPT